MNRAEILAMKPGPELDVLVAEHVFGWRKVPGPKTDYDGPCESFDVLVPPTIDDPFPLYPPRGAIKPWWFCRNWSTDLVAAWEVAEKRRKEFFQLTGPFGRSDWECSFSPTTYAQGKTVPEAICKAALLAVVDKP